MRLAPEEILKLLTDDGASLFSRDPVLFKQCKTAIVTLSELYRSSKNKVSPDELISGADTAITSKAQSTIDDAQSLCSLLRGQSWFINRMTALGYQLEKGGHCFGTSRMAMYAFLANDMDAFDKRLQTIQDIPLDDFDNNFSNLRTKHQQLIEEGLTDKAITLNNKMVDILAYFDGVALHQSPHQKQYQELFNEKIFKYHSNQSETVGTQHAMSVVLPIALDTQKKQPVLVKSFTGAYDKNELAQYLALLQSSIGKQHSFSLMLGSANHAINLNYNHMTSQWVFVDPTKLPARTYIHPDLLATALLDSYDQKNGLVLNTELYTNREHAPATQNNFSLLEQTEVWTKLHQLTQDKIMKVYPPDTNNQLFYAVDQKNYAWLEQALTVRPLDLGYFELLVLESACDDKQMRTIELALDCGAKPSTALLKKAMDKGNFILVDLFIEKSGPSLMKRACSEGQLDVVELLTNKSIQLTTEMLEEAYLDEKINVVNLLTDKGVQPSQDMLRYACIKGDIPAINTFIDKGCALTEDMLKNAYLAGDADMIQFLTNKGLELCSVSLPHLMEEAYNFEAIDGVNYLIAQEVKPTNSMLRNVIFDKNSDLIDVFIIENYKVIEKIFEEVCRFEQVEVIDFLIDKGIQPTDQIFLDIIRNNKMAVINVFTNKNIQIQKMLGEACRLGKTHVVDLLMSKGAQATESMLKEAYKNGHIDTVHLLNDKGITVDPTTALGQIIEDTFIFTSVVGIEVLIDQGAQVSLNMFLGASLDDHFAVVALLSRKCGQSLLSEACLKNNMRAINLLIDEGVKPTQDMLEQAYQQGQSEVIQRLTDAGLQPTPVMIDESKIKNPVPTTLTSTETIGIFKEKIQQMKSPLKEVPSVPDKTPSSIGKKNGQG